MLSVDLDMNIIFNSEGEIPNEKQSCAGSDIGLITICSWPQC